MNVLFLAAEASPYIKVGGLGDVAGALPPALRSKGADVRLFIPRYGPIDPQHWKLHKVLDNFPVEMDWRREECQLWATEDEKTYFIENHFFFGSRPTIYGAGDDAERFVLFCRAALESVRHLGWNPQVIHGHDWHAAAAIRIHWAAPHRAALVYTIHNIAHQGQVGNSRWPLLGVYDGKGQLNLMQQAVYAADVITTVSPTYAQEIQTEEYGFGLEWILRQRRDRLVGILNGIDTNHYNPETDPDLAANYSAKNLKGKIACKSDLQRQMGLPVRGDVPLIGVISRLDDQKGIKLILDSLGDLFALTQAQFAVLGSGYQPYEHAFHLATSHHPDRIANYIGFNSTLARRIYAGADIFLMPSRFEPCGLSQMIAMRYGAVPVARATGGLVDTIRDCSTPGGTGYLFGPYERQAMLWALGRALRDYHDPTRWTQIVRTAMQKDFSWSSAAERYLQVYEWACSLIS